MIVSKPLVVGFENEGGGTTQGIQEDRMTVCNQVLMMTLAKQQHYIPQFYLNYFGRSRKRSYQIWCYDLENEKPYLTSVARIAKEKDYYNFDISDDCFASIDESLTRLEACIAPAYAHLVHCMNPRALTMEERSFIAAFCATLLTRVPRFEEECRAIEGLIQEKISADNESYRNLKFGQSQLKRFAGTMTNTSLVRSAPIFFAMQWSVGLTRVHAFVHTSDNPLVRHNPRDSGLYWPCP
jgi:hypothetical protein